MSFYVLRWNVNFKTVEKYDVMPYLEREWEDMLERNRNKKNFKKPTEFEEVKVWILKESKYQFWSRCEYEIIVSSWPEGMGRSKKIDVYNQIEMNIDVITKLFMERV